MSSLKADTHPLSRKEIREREREEETRKEGLEEADGDHSGLDVKSQENINKSVVCP